LEEELKKFNGLASAHEAVSCTTLSGTYLAECLLCDPDFACELSDVDAALLCLRTRIGNSRMRPILGKLFGQFSPLNPVEDWDQALSEIFTFARFESLGVLHSIGWPSGFAGDHPSYDFAIDIQGNILAGDIKPANGSGYRLLEADLRKCVSDRAAQSGIADPCVTIRYRGPLTQEIVGPNRRLAISDFELQIANKPLSEPHSFILTIGSTRVTVIVGETKELGGGMTGTSVLSDALAPTLKSHMESKGRSADNYDVPFCLPMYDCQDAVLQTSRLMPVPAIRFQKHARYSREVPFQIGLALCFCALEPQILNRGSMRVRMPLGRLVFLPSPFLRTSVQR
jgi:hypothetical protein